MASAPSAVSVTLYRDPDREPDQQINREWPRGFAMINETRTVTLPPGESTIRFEGVAEGMVAVSAIVTGLPGGTIEKNRNADLLSPAALVDGTLGNRVTITRTNPATGAESAESAVVRTRADGGLVLQTAQGYEAVRCAGIPEKLTFDRVPDGLSAQPVFSIDTRDASGGTYQVQLTYIAWGFDWQAHYVGTFQDAASSSKEKLHLRSWLTLVNDNGQSFEDATLLVVAGKLNVESDYQGLSDPPQGRGLNLTCYPLGSTAEGSPEGGGAYPAPPPPPAPMAAYDNIVVTAQARGMMEKASPVAMVATEEALGDLKLYRVPERVSVSSKSMKQVAFLDRDAVEGELEYRFSCSPWDNSADAQALRRVLRTKNDRKHGLGVALPMGGVTLFEPSSAGELLVGEETLRDYAEGQDVEIGLGESPNAFALCARQTEAEPGDEGNPWLPTRATLTNANRHPIKVRVELGRPADWALRKKVKGMSVKDGQWVIERTIPAGTSVNIDWEIRSAEAEES
ncbi:hypothetical protein H0274_02990 [Altererythrobacter sp. CC-YST694]|uniref:DUF4139 domain-containing protein n=1 Tax=Altererythrobacter sp. CC-YST694 TaxID=2755038 RepID=UPI001D026244|nr:hypothetical protein [Altererythrobacter sp. CC-YST694]MCB5424215.1 hypothetical protein [Altererythrobacter sp. CC-YST694]